MLASTVTHARYRQCHDAAVLRKSLTRPRAAHRSPCRCLGRKAKDVGLVGSKTDLIQWYNRTTLNIVGDLAFGQSFDGLQDADSILDLALALYQHLGILSVQKVLLLFTTGFIEKSTNDHKRRATATDIHELCQRQETTWWGDFRGLL